jgi:hypothetical protein
MLLRVKYGELKYFCSQENTGGINDDQLGSEEDV